MIRRLIVLALVTVFVAACGGTPAGSPAATTATTAAPATPVAKTKLRVLYLDDPSRFATLYAIQQGIVKSDKIDVEFSFLPLAAAIEAFQTKKFDVLEASPVGVAASAGAGFKTLITSAALENKGGTLLFTAANSAVREPKDLKGKTIGVASLGGTFTLETRYVLQEKYGLNTNPQGGDVRFQEVPPDAMPGLMKDGKLDAAVLLHIPAWKLEQDSGFRVMLQVTKEFTAITGLLSMNSVMLTYPEIAQEKRPAIDELNRMLRESTDYASKNLDKVNEAVAKEKGVPAAFLAWWWKAYNYPHGSLSDQHKKEIVGIWTAAAKLGAVKAVPNIDEYSLK